MDKIQNKWLHLKLLRSGLRSVEKKRVEHSQVGGFVVILQFISPVRIKNKANVGVKQTPGMPGAPERV